MKRYCWLGYAAESNGYNKDSLTKLKLHKRPLKEEKLQ